MRCLILCLLVACSSAASHSVKLTNRTPRAIEAIYVYPAGSSNHGSSKGALAPGAAMSVSIKEGNVDVLAVAAEEQLANGQRERKQATQTLELRGPLELIFHDSTTTIVEQAGTIGVVFRVVPVAE